MFFFISRFKIRTRRSCLPVNREKIQRPGWAVPAYGAIGLAIPMAGTTWAFLTLIGLGLICGVMAYRPYPQPPAPPPAPPPPPLNPRMYHSDRR